MTNDLIVCTLVGITAKGKSLYYVRLGQKVKYVHVSRYVCGLLFKFNMSKNVRNRKVF